MEYRFLRAGLIFGLMMLLNHSHAFAKPAAGAFSAKTRAGIAAYFTYLAGNFHLLRHQDWFLQRTAVPRTPYEQIAISWVPESPYPNSLNYNPIGFILLPFVQVYSASVSMALFVIRLHFECFLVSHYLSRAPV